MLHTVLGARRPGLHASEGWPVVWAQIRPVQVVGAWLLVRPETRPPRAVMRQGTISSNAGLCSRIIWRNSSVITCSGSDIRSLSPATQMRHPWSARVSIRAEAGLKLFIEVILPGGIRHLIFWLNGLFYPSIPILSRYPVTIIVF